MKFFMPGCTAFTGLWGSGKTLAMVEACQQAQAAGWNVATNFGYFDADFQFRSVDDLLWLIVNQLSIPVDERKGLYLAIDEAGQLFPARGWKEWPAELDILIQQSRKLDVAIGYTAPSLSFVDVNFRRVTGVVFKCKGSFPKRISAKGVQPVKKGNTVFMRSAYLAEEAESARARPLGVSWSLLRKDVAGAYDTMHIVDSLRESLTEYLHKPRPDVIVVGDWSSGS